MSKTQTVAAASAAATPASSTPADPFADVPTITTSDGSNIRDFSEVQGNNPFKYAEVHARAVAVKHPMLINYKHGQSVLVPGSYRKELKPGSVYGTIQQIVNQAGKAGIPVYELLTRLRQAQIGNKRSKYCTSLPPIGWGEGWLNTALTKNIVGVHATKTASAFEAEKSKPEPEQKQLAG